MFGILGSGNRIWAQGIGNRQRALDSGRRQLATGSGPRWTATGNRLQATATSNGNLEAALLKHEGRQREATGGNDGNGVGNYFDTI